MSATPEDADVERQTVSLAAKEGAAAPDAQPAEHQAYARAKDRLRHFLHPNGKRVHVALSPHEATHLRKTLEQVHKPEDFDVVLSGTKEHLDTLKDAHDHHTTKREALRDQHRDVYEHITNVNQDLADIANELDRVTTHGVKLEAHFTRFGYDAHVRSYDDNEEPGTASRRSSMSGETIAEG